MFLKRILIVTMAVMLAFTSSVAIATDEIDDLKEEFDQLEDQQIAIQSQIDKTKNDKEKQLAIKGQLDHQIYSVKQQITVLNTQVTVTEENIATKEDELEALNQELEDSNELLRDRMNAMYKTGNVTLLGLVLGAEDFFQFLSRSQVVSKIAEDDRALMDGLQETLKEVQLIKEGIEQEKLELEAVKEQLSGKQTQLGGQLADAQEAIMDIDELQRQYAANKSAIDKQMAAAQAEIDRIYAENESKGIYEGGIMSWPVVGYNTVTSDYGWRFNNTNNHTGIDIARTNSAGQGIYGKPIRAAANGTVMFTQTSAVYGKGYGVYAIIDHGGGISTLYGHQSGLNVRSGQTVNRGDTIGYVGSTGWSTGPHLHFEVRVNGKHVNPWTYLRG